MTKVEFLEDLPDKVSKALNLFWLGFCIYWFFYCIATISPSGKATFQSGQAVGLLIMFSTIPFIIRFKIKNVYLKNIYILYLLWIIFLLASAYKYFSDYSFLKQFHFNDNLGILYLCPIVLLFPMNIHSIKKIYNVIIIFSICFFIYDLLFFKRLIAGDLTNRNNLGVIENLSNLSFAAGFILFTYGYHSISKQGIAICAVLLTIIFAIVNARRGLILMFSQMAVISGFIYFLYSGRRFFILYISILFLLVVALFANRLYKPIEINFLDALLERGIEDTRSGVELCFFDDMKTIDLIFGRGIKGEYFCPGIEEEQATNYRSLIETGYLQTILKGGLISLGLFLLIAIPAIFKGLFFSRNMLSKAAALWILLAIINSYITIIDAFTLQYLLVWVSIGICYSDEVINIPDKELKYLFKKVKN